MKKFLTKLAAVAASVTLLGSVALAGEAKVYYTDDKADIEEDRDDFKIVNLVPETTADADISEFTFDLVTADDVTFNEYAAICFIVTVDGEETIYKILGIGAGGDAQFVDYADIEWAEGGHAIKGAKLALDAPIASGSTYSVDAFTQSWAGAADEVYTVTLPGSSEFSVATKYGDQEGEAEESTSTEESASTEESSADAPAPAPTDTTPKTGDNTMVAVLAVVALLSLAGVVVVSKKRA